MITDPGVYHDLDEQEYHAQHAWLSHSGARKLLPPSCPALFRWWLEHPDPPKDHFDFGHAAHKAILGVGLEVVEVESPNWNKKADQQTRKDARARGAVALLSEGIADTQAMTAAVRDHPIAGKLLSGGKPEQSLFWDDNGVQRRGRVDYVKGRFAVDLKTSDSADPDAFRKSAVNFGYDMQAPWYLDGLKATGHDVDAFLFVVVQKAAPYLVSVVELDAEFIRIGRAKNQRAIDIYQQCATTDTWPGWGDDDVTLIGPPSWYAAQQQAEEAA